MAASESLRAAAEAAFPGEEWDEDRLAGLKDLIMECTSSDYDSDDEGSGDDEDDDTGPPSGKGGKGKPKLDIGILFGPPKKRAG